MISDWSRMAPEPGPLPCAAVLEDLARIASPARCQTWMTAALLPPAPHQAVIW